MTASAAGSSSCPFSSSLYPLLASIGLSAVAMFLLSVIAGNDAVRSVAKPVPVLVLALCVVLPRQGGGEGCASKRSRGRYSIALGLVCSAAGDVLLDMDGKFLLGMVAFAVAHVAYIIAFLKRNSSLCLGHMLPFSAWIGWVVYNCDNMSPSYQIPVYLYGVVLTAMAWRAAAIARTECFSSWFPMVGALLFAFSDSMIAMNKFHRSFNGAVFAIILTYWLGQFLIAASAIVVDESSSSGSSSSSSDDVNACKTKSN